MLELTKECQCEMYGLTAKSPASVSVPANMADRCIGRERHQIGSFNFFELRQALTQGVDTHLILAEQVQLVRAEALEQVNAMTDEVGRMLRAIDPIAARQDWRHRMSPYLFATRHSLFASDF